MSEIQTIFPEVSADEDVSQVVEEDHKEFEQANKDLDKILADVAAGKLAYQADVEAQITEVKTKVNEAYKKYQSSIDERVAQSIAAKAKDSKDEVLAEVRQTVGDLIQGQGPREVSAFQAYSGWQKIEASADEPEGHITQLRPPGRESVVLYADIRDSSRMIEAADIASPAQGAGTTQISPYVQLEQGDPFMEFATIINPTNPHFTVPYVGGTLTPVKNRTAALPATAADISGTGAVSADKWELRVDYPNTSEDDLIGFRDAVAMRHIMAYGLTWGAEVVAGLKGYTGFGAAQTVETEVANSLMTAENTPAKLAEMMGALKSVYRMGAVWMLQESVEARINEQWSNAGAAISPLTGRTMILGHQVRINSHLDDGGTDNDVSAWFGSWGLAVTEAMYREVEIRYFNETSPGDITVYSIFRAALAPTDGRAAVKLVTSA